MLIKWGNNSKQNKKKTIINIIISTFLFLHPPPIPRKKNHLHLVDQVSSADLVVQVVQIAESIRLQCVLATYGIMTQTPNEIEPVQIWSQWQMVKVYEHLGRNESLGLEGRPSRPIGSLGSSKVSAHNRVVSA